MLPVFSYAGEARDLAADPVLEKRMIGLAENFYKVDAAFLLARGLNVVGVDLSEVATREAKLRWPDLQAVLADLSHFGLPVAAFDVIINFYFLDRKLWPV